MQIIAKNSVGVFIIVTSVVAFAYVGCATQKRDLTYLDYSEAAQIMYEDGMKSFEKERWTEAQKIFQDVKTKYPYSKFASIAELRIGDCSYNLGSHAEAAVIYQHFLKLYPTHEQAHYAAYKKGKAYYAQIPGEWLLTPPVFEKDQTATRDARAALGFFIRTYKDSPHVEEAKELYEEVEAALVRHEMYVAGFYLKREKRNAAAVRLDSIPKQFPNSKLVPDAMFLKAITLLEMGKIEDAVETFVTIVALHEDDPQAKRAKKYLRQIKEANLL